MTQMEVVVTAVLLGSDPPWIMQLCLPWALPIYLALVKLQCDNQALKIFCSYINKQVRGAPSEE